VSIKLNIYLGRRFALKKSQ